MDATSIIKLLKFEDEERFQFDYNYENGRLLFLPIVLKDAYLSLNLGKPDTALKQAIDFIRVIKFELERSPVIRILFTKIIDTYAIEGNEIILYFGKHTSSIFDSAPNWTVDFDDFMILPDEPIIDHETGHLIGHNKGEMIIHVLEERLYMTKPGKNFSESHYKCLSRNSFQNQYREERGYTYNVVTYELIQHTKKHTQDEFSDWEGFDEGGHVMTIKNVHTGKIYNESIYSPNPEQIIYEKMDISQFLDEQIVYHVNDIREEFKSLGTISEENRVSIEFYAHWRFSDEAMREKLLYETVYPFTIGFARKKTWNVIRVQIQNKRKKKTIDELILLGKNTFKQNYFNKTIPKSWQTILYPNEEDIIQIKGKLKENLLTIYEEKEENIIRIIQELEKHF